MFCFSLGRIKLDIPVWLEIPLGTQRRINEERLVVVGVVDEVVANLNLCTEAEMRRHIVPQLRLGEHHELSVTVGFLSAPEVDEAGECDGSIGEVQSPDARELEAVVAAGVLIALEEALVHELHRPGLREVGIVAVIGGAQKGGLLEAAEAVQAAVVLHVCGNGQLLAQIEFARNLRVGSLGELTAEVDIDEVEPRAPLVGFELFKRHCNFLSSSLFVGIDEASEVVVQLHILCLRSHAHQ